MANHPFKLKKPCNNCPFRKEGAIELHPDRLKGIVEDLLSDDSKTFHCHKTVHSEDGGDWEDGEYIPSGKEAACYGAMSFLAKANRPNVPTRIAHSFGLVDINELKSNPEIIEPCELK